MVPPKIQNLLAGLAAGALGGLLMMAFLAVVSVVERDPWWRYANLFGTTFYGDWALRSGPGLATLAGCALQVLVSGALGAGFGFVFGGRYSRLRVALLGVLTGLAWSYLSEALYRRFNPLIPLYTETVPATLAHLVFGTCLGTLSGFLPPRASRPEPEPQPQREQTPLVEESASEPSSNSGANEQLK